MLKYILDIEQMISEIDFLKKRYSGDFNHFKNDWVAIRAIERQLQIISEASDAIIKIDPGVDITSSRNIVDLRNLIVHSYDSVDSAIIWGIIQKDVPTLKEEIKALKAKM